MSETIDPANVALMQGIRTKYGRFIERAVAGTMLPEGLVAALVANEAGLSDTAQRFEIEDFREIAFVAVGRKAAHDRPTFGAIGRQDLSGYLTLTGVGAIGQLIELASSWGPLQIMGYEALAGHFPLSELKDPNRCFVHGVHMLELFRAKWNLPLPTTDYAPYFRCWNTGRPDGKTFDPEYAANGALRLSIYEAPPAAPPEAA